MSNTNIQCQVLEKKGERKNLEGAWEGGGGVIVTKP